MKTMAKILAVMLGALAWSGVAFCGEIHEAVSRGDVGKIKKLLKRQPLLVNDTDTYGWTPLHYASVRRRKDVIELLLAHKATINAEDNDGKTPLQRAMENNETWRKEIGALLRKHGGRVGRGADIYDAVDAVDLESVEAKLRANPELAACVHPQRGTLLHWVAWNGGDEVAAVLVRHQADVNAKFIDGFTPLHWAAVKGHYEVAKVLLENGADVSAKLVSGVTPLQGAASNGRTELVKLLLEFKSDACGRDNNARTPLHDAVMFGHTEIAALLLAKNCDINAKDRSGTTPLHLAACYEHREAVEFLLARGANIEAVDDAGWTPLHLAAHAGQSGMLEVLLKHKASINAKDKKGRTPLRLVVEREEQASADLLRDDGMRAFELQFLRIQRKKQRKFCASTARRSSGNNLRFPPSEFRTTGFRARK
jgi:ankyrin repeat protein